MCGTCPTTHDLRGPPVHSCEPESFIILDAICLVKDAGLKMSLLLHRLSWIAAAAAAGQSWVPQQSGTTASLRGVSAVSPTVVWASGSRGTYVRTTDGGATWRAATVPGAADLDFRAVRAVDER